MQVITLEDGSQEVISAPKDFTQHLPEFFRGPHAGKDEPADTMVTRVSRIKCGGDLAGIKDISPEQDDKTGRQDHQERNVIQEDVKRRTASTRP